ncbi:MAG TPA: hypothetical protein PLU39_00850 [Armatimonadota bacterium]|jgi:hypothetical protein|nr:hypothetical protein [Armatimonadota bacterium]
MKKVLLMLALLTATATAFAAENQAFWGVFAETRVQKMAGMPALPPLPPGVDAGAMAQIPGMAAVLGMGAPQRTLSVRLWSPGIAPQGATATITPPAGLKQGDRLVLDLYRPKPGETGPGEEAGTEESSFTIKRYWGSSEKVKPGQPEVIRWDTLSPELKAAARREAAEAASKESYFYKPDWTTAYWPTGKQPGRIANDASLPGKYTLTTSYTGSVSIDVPQGVDFLAPIELSSPDLTKLPSLDGAITFRWKPVPGILGYHARIIGMQQEKKTLILWSSSEVQDEPSGGWDYLEMAEVAKHVKSTAMMEPTRQEMTVPAGIFKECDVVYFTMTGYGPGAALAEGQPLPRVQTKTTLNIMLGGKAMGQMGE